MCVVQYKYELACVWVGVCVCVYVHAWVFVGNKIWTNEESVCMCFSMVIHSTWIIIFVMLCMKERKNEWMNALFSLGNDLTWDIVHIGILRRELKSGCQLLQNNETPHSSKGKLSDMVMNHWHVRLKLCLSTCWYYYY